jgi:hypothetical protein
MMLHIDACKISNPYLIFFFDFVFNDINTKMGRGICVELILVQRSPTPFLKIRFRIPKRASGNVDGRSNPKKKRKLIYGLCRVVSID